MQVWYAGYIFQYERGIGGMFKADCVSTHLLVERLPVFL